MNRQIFLRILPNRLDQLLGVGQQLIGIVVNRGIAQELASAAFTRSVRCRDAGNSMVVLAIPTLMFVRSSISVSLRRDTIPSVHLPCHAFWKAERVSRWGGTGTEMGGLLGAVFAVLAACRVECVSALRPVLATWPTRDRGLALYVSEQASYVPAHLSLRRRRGGVSTSSIAGSR